MAMTAVDVASVARRFRLSPPKGRLQVYAAISAFSFVCYIVGQLTQGSLSDVFSMVGLGACGWAWLLTRALFDPAPRDAVWAPVVGLAVVGTGALSVILPEGGAAFRVIENGYVLSGSAAVLLTFTEPFQRYRRDLAVGEKRFRLMFVGLYVLLVGVAILGFRTVGEGAEAARLDAMVKAACALVSLAGVMAAMGFRLRHPLTAGPVKRTPTPEDARIAERLVRLMAEEAIHSRPDLKIGDVAARLAEPEHRVSQAIGSALGFANFNRWINHQRIARAKAMLADPADTRSILQIAFDCGFGSLGPFNRAFREETGTTPRAFRVANR